LGKVEALDADVGDADSVLFESGAIGEAGEAVHQIGALDSAGWRNERFEVVAAERGREAGPDDVVEAHLGGDRVADALEEAVGILDAPGDISVDDNVLFVAREELGGPGIVDAKATVEVSRALERPLHVQAGLSDGVERAAKLRHQDELGFLNGE